MDPIYLGGPRPPSEPMDQDFVTDDDEEDQLLSDVDDVPSPPSESRDPPKPALPSGQEIEPDPIDDDEPSTSGQKRKGARKSGGGLYRLSGHSHLPEERVDNILEENGAAGPMSKEATFLLSIATEEFVRRFTQAGHMIAASEQRDVVEYGDLAQSTSMRCFSMLEDVVPCPKPLTTALELRAQFMKRQVAEDPALTTAALEPMPLPDPEAPLVALPTAASAPWDVTPAPTKRQKSAPSAPSAAPSAPPIPAHASTSLPYIPFPPSPTSPPASVPTPIHPPTNNGTSASAGASASSGKRKAREDAATRERRASTRQRDRHGRFGNNPIDPRVWDNKFAPAPAAAPPQDPWANQPPAALPGPPNGLAPPAETPFAQTGRTIYSQR